MDFSNHPNQAAVHETYQIMAAVKNVIPDIATGDYNKLFSMVLEQKTKEPQEKKAVPSQELRRMYSETAPNIRHNARFK